MNEVVKMIKIERVCIDPNKSLGVDLLCKFLTVGATLFVGEFGADNAHV